MNILVISNDLMERSVIQQVLENSGQKVTFAQDSNEAVNLIKQSDFRFIIIDESGQDQSIQQFTKNIRSSPNQNKHIYILLLISKDQKENIAVRLSEGADDYLNKPITPQELKIRVAVGVRILSMGDILSQANEQLEGQAMYDNLTGLMNRQAFHKVAQGELERARRTVEGVSVIALDIKNFKAINDKYGHDVGDDVLKIVAQIIREKCRPYDCIGRWAGDQFTIALSGIVSSDAEKIINRIMAGVKSSDITLKDGDALEVTLNAGIASTQNINAYADIGSFIVSAVQVMTSSKKNDDDAIGIVFV